MENASHITSLLDVNNKVLVHPLHLEIWSKLGRNDQSFSVSRNRFPKVILSITPDSVKFISQLYSTKFPGINLNSAGIEMGNFPTGQDLSCDSLLWREDILQHLWESGNRFCFITLIAISLQKKQQPPSLQGSCCQTNRMLKTTESRSRWAGH